MVDSNNIRGRRAFRIAIGITALAILLLGGGAGALSNSGGADIGSETRGTGVNADRVNSD